MRKIILAAMLVLAAMPLTAAQASDCPIGTSAASASHPLVTDPSNDWEGVVFGNGSATVPGGDIYREGTDLTAGWISSAADGSMTANIQVASLSDAQPNAIFYFLWTNGEVGGAPGRRWVSARLKGYTTAYSFGNLVAGTLPTSAQTFKTEGDGTGRLIPAENLIQIDLPRGGTSFSGYSTDDWGAPAAGSELEEPLIEARILLGSPEPLPSNPSGLRHGFVYLADDSLNGETCNGTVD